jgi:DNA-binding MarR family transcriptional regulator
MASIRGTASFVWEWAGCGGDLPNSISGTYLNRIPLTELVIRVRIQKLNARTMTEIKQHEYDLLNEIARDSLVTQANLSNRLGIAVGSVNWYIKRLIQRGWVKVSHLDRTRLKYDLTSEGMSVFTQRALLYARDSLKVYGDFRSKAKALVADLKQKGIHQVSIAGDDEIMDILRLTCIEAGIQVAKSANGVTVTVEGRDYRVNKKD